MIWEVPGIRVGHWTDPQARTGCTVALFDRAPVASGEVRGGAPATHEFALLDPFATVEQIDAVVLTGGSAFGLAATDGVVRCSIERDRGFPTTAGPIPIVVGLSLFDLMVGDGIGPPRPGRGPGGLQAAVAGSRETGSVGAGCGRDGRHVAGPELAVPGGWWERWPATVTWWWRRWSRSMRGATCRVMAGGPSRRRPSTGPGWTPGLLRQHHHRGGGHQRRPGQGGLPPRRPTGPTTAWPGPSRHPTPGLDGDAFVAVATGEVDAAIELVRAHAVELVDTAIRSLAHPGR